MKRPLTTSAALRARLVITRLSILCLVALSGYLMLPANTARMQSAFAKTDDGSPIELQSPQTARPDILWMRGGHIFGFSDIKYSANGQTFASVANDRTIKIWRTSDGILLRTIILASAAVYHSSTSITADGQRIAVPTINPNTIEIYQVSDGALINTIANAGATVISLSPDGSLVAGAGKVWQTSTGALVQDLSAMANGITAFSPNGQLLAVTGGSNGGIGELDIGLFSTSNWTLVRNLVQAGSNPVFSPGGQYLAATSGNGPKVFIVSNGSSITLQSVTGSPYGATAAFSPDGQYFASGDNAANVKLWQISISPTWSFLRQFQAESTGGNGDVPRVAFSGSNELITARINLKLWNPATGTLIRRIDGQSAIVSTTAFSPDGQMFATGTLLNCSLDNAVRVWRTSDGVLLNTLSYSNAACPQIYSVAFSADGQSILVSVITDLNGSALLSKWRLSDNSLIFTVPQGERSRTFAIAPDRQTVVFGGKDLRLVSAADGSLIRTLSGGGSSNTNTPLAFSPDGQSIASRRDEQLSASVILYRISDGSQIQTFANSSSTIVGNFSPDGQTFVGGENTRNGNVNPANIRQWRISNGALIQTFVGHTLAIQDVKFSLDGQKLISTGYDKTLRFWQVSNASLLQTFTEETKFDYPSNGSIALSPDGSRFAYGRFDSAVVMARNPYPSTPVTTYTINGNITRGGSPLSGVSVALSGSSANTATTNLNGDYSLTVAEGGSYTVTPQLANNTFAPTSQTFNFIAANQSANFTAALVTYTISGNVKADGANLQNATVSLSGAQTASVSTGADGNYSFTVPAGAGYTVSVYRGGINFNTASQSFTSLQANQIANFQNGAAYCAPPSAGLIAWYRGENNANDSSGNGYNGSLVNGTTYGAAKVGQGFALDGVNDWVLVNDNDVLDGFTRMSASAWVKFNSLPSNRLQFILAKSSTTVAAGSDAYSIFYDSTVSPGKLKIILGNTTPTTSPIVQTSFSDTTSFHHIAFSYDGSSIKLYLDGALVDNQPFSGTIMNTPYNLTIGRRSGTGVDGQGDVLNGLIDETQIYNRALSASEIGAIYNAGSAGGCTNSTTTPIGSNINASNNGVGLTFNAVSQAGNTIAVSIAPASAGVLPMSYQLIPQSVAYDISTSAQFSGNITTTFNVPNVLDAATCASLRMLHYNAATNQLENVTSGTNGYNSMTQVCTVWGMTTSLSPFVIAQFLTPTAASVTVGGRVTTADGSGIRNAFVTLTDSNGNSRTALTGKFGAYRFREVASGETYIISVSARRYTFSQPSQVRTVVEDLTDVDFVANE